MTTTTEIADKIATEQNLTKAQAKAIVESVFKEISEAARSGAETSIPGFGKFKVKDTPAREGRNPSTGAAIKIAATKKLSFTPAKAGRAASMPRLPCTTSRCYVDTRHYPVPTSAG